MRRRARQASMQAQVAEAMETTQSVVSAFEQASGDARVSTVQRYARAVGARLRLVHSLDTNAPDTTAPVVEPRRSVSG